MSQKEEREVSQVQNMQRIIFVLSLGAHNLKWLQDEKLFILISKKKTKIQDVYIASIWVSVGLIPQKKSPKHSEENSSLFKCQCNLFKLLTMYSPSYFPQYKPG